MEGEGWGWGGNRAFLPSIRKIFFISEEAMSSGKIHFTSLKITREHFVEETTSDQILHIKLSDLMLKCDTQPYLL